MLGLVIGLRKTIFWFKIRIYGFICSFCL